MPGCVPLVATIALDVGNAPVLKTVHRESLAFLDHALAYCHADEPYAAPSFANRARSRATLEFSNPALHAEIASLFALI